MSRRTEGIVEWLRRQLTQSGARGFVFGLSGGVDSAVVAGLCHAAAPSHAVGVLMPCHSDPRDEADAALVAAHFGMATIRVDLGPSFDRFTATLVDAVSTIPPELLTAASGAAGEMDARMPLANVKPRLRMTALYYVANTLNCMVAGTGNRSELAVGYFTKYGDGGADVLPIGELLKSEVRAAAQELGVPDAIIDKAPSAGLWSGQSDEAEMGFSYAELEKYLKGGAEMVSPALAMRIERLIRASEHKRNVPPTPGAE